MQIKKPTKGTLESWKKLPRLLRGYYNSKRRRENRYSRRGEGGETGLFQEGRVRAGAGAYSDRVEGGGSMWGDPVGVKSHRKVP